MKSSTCGWKSIEFNGVIVVVVTGGAMLFCGICWMN